VDPYVVVSAESVASADPGEIIHSNIVFVNALLKEQLRYEEIAPDSLRSYYVDYYLAQMENGGFSQFVYNSRWSLKLVRLVREGLAAIRAEQHLKLFDECCALLERLGENRLEAFLKGELFGPNAERDFLNAHNDRFYALTEIEDLIALNGVWLRKLPGLQVMNTNQMLAEVERRAAALPDREERNRAALENAPRYMKLIRALVAQAGQKLVRVNAGNLNHEYNGKRTVAWHFSTDKGHHYMVDSDGRALMFDGTTNSLVAQVDAPGM
jgi:hypothetical protein